MGAAAAAIVAKEKRIVAAFRQAGATSRESAMTREAIGLHGHLAFSKLVGHAVLREAGEGRFYLDEQKWEALRQFRQRLALGMLLLVAAGLLTAYLVTRG